MEPTTLWHRNIVRSYSSRLHVARTRALVKMSELLLFQVSLCSSRL